MWKRFSMFQRIRMYILIFHIVPLSVFSIHMLCRRCHMWKAEKLKSCGLLIKIQKFLGSKNFKQLSNFVNSSPANLSHSTSTCMVIMSCEPSKIPLVIHLAKFLTSSISPLSVNVCSQFGELSSHSIFPHPSLTRCLQWKIYSNWNISVCSTRSILCWWKNYIVRSARCCNSTITSDWHWCRKVCLPCVWFGLAERKKREEEKNVVFW